MASRHAADRSSLDRDANRVRDLPNNKARNLPQCPAFPGFDIFTENFFNEGSPNTLHFVPGKATEPAAATVKPDIGVSDVLTTPPQGPLTAHGQVFHDQYPPTPERHPPGFVSEWSPARKQATQLEELLVHSKAPSNLSQYPSSVIPSDKPLALDVPITAPQYISPAPHDQILSSISTYTYPPPVPKRPHDHTPSVSILPEPPILSSIPTHLSPSDNITSGKRPSSKKGNFLLEGKSHHFTWSLSEGSAAMSSPPSDSLCIPAVGDLHLHINTTLEQTKANCQCWMYYGDKFGWRDITQTWISNDGSVTHPLYSSHILHRQPNRLNPNYIINPAHRSRSKSPSFMIASNPQNMSLLPPVSTQGPTV